MGLSHSPSIVTDGLVLCLDAANRRSYPGSGTSWTDIKRKSDRTLTNGAEYNSDFGGNINFDGTNDLVNTGFHIGWNDTNSVTISFHVRPNTLSQTKPFLGTNGYEWQIRQNNTSLQFIYWNTFGSHTNGPIPNITDFFLNTNDFVYVSVVWNHVDNKYYFYRNGVLVNTTVWYDASINKSTSYYVHVGGNVYNWGSMGSYWNGSITNLTMYNIPLSSDEIRRNYLATKSRFGL